MQEPTTQQQYTVSQLAQAVAGTQWKLDYQAFADALGEPAYFGSGTNYHATYAKWEQFQALSKSLAACAPWLEKVIKT